MRFALGSLLALLLCLQGGSAGAQDADGLRAEGPVRVPGDGRTPFEVVVRNAPRGTAVANADIVLDSGRLIARRELDEAGMVLELLPPRVVEPSVMTVSVRIQGLGRTEHRVELIPALGTSGRFQSKGALALDVPERLILGVDQEAEIRFRSPRGSAVHLFASEGSISAPSAKNGSISVAKYQPPESKFPILAIVVATGDDGALLDWASIKLYGQPSVATRSEADAAVTVKIDGESFGPIRADRHGRGTMRVLVPPGVEQARVLARDALGNESTVPLALGTPAPRPLYALCPAESERVYLFALDGAGRPRADVKLLVTSSLGELSVPQPVRGYSVSNLSLPPSVAMDAPLVFHAEIDGEPASRTRCDSHVVGEAPISMNLSAVPSTWTPSVGDHIKVQVKLEFAGYRTPRVVPVSPAVDFGEVAAVETPSPELYEVTWRLPSRLDGRAVAHMTLRTDTAKPVSGSLELPVSPALPESIALRCGTERLVADGHSETTLEVAVLDRYGNPLRDADLITTATGSVSRFRRGPGGTLVATYRVPRSLHRSSDLIEVRLRGSSLVAKKAISLDPIRRGTRIFAKVGYTMPLGKLSGPAVSVGAAYRLPVLDGGLLVASELGFSSAEQVERDAGDTEDVELRSMSLPIGIGLHYELNWTPISPYVALGPKLGITRLAVRSDSSGELDEWTLSPGAWIALGLLVQAGPGAVIFDSEYSHLPAKLGGITGNVGGLFVGAGYAIEL